MEHNMYLYIYIYYFLLYLVNSSSLPNNLDYNEYSDGYGTKWIYFPDGDGVPHYVNLTITEDDMPDIRNSMFDDIKYKLYIRNDTDSYILLDGLGKAIDKSYQKITNDVLLTNMPLKIITHGWRSSVDNQGVLNMKNAYLETRQVNVITVDWSSTADSVLYHWVANETKTIGARLALFLDQLNYWYNVTGKQIHLIGHSLGAHIMGITASRVKKMTVSRITGLDPARPLFEYPPQDNSAKLDATDAEFVDVIHTCGGVLGCEAPIGTVDFYPNNGIAPQPGCDILKFFEACSHGRSFNYFTESIKYPKSFPAYQCQSWTDFLKNQCSRYDYMGEGANRKMSGVYYLITNRFEPFGLRT